MNAFEKYSHARLLTECRTWRELTLAALDQLHELQTDNAVQDRIIKRLREELRERQGVPMNGDLR